MPILKTLSRKGNTDQLVKYIFRYIFKEEEKKVQSSIDKPFILRHNIRSRSLKGIIKEFQQNEAYRLVHRKDSVKLFHTILSFSTKDKDKINDKLLKDIFKKFVTERGLTNLYAGTKHEDKNHIHLHISVSGTQLNGRSSRTSKQQLHHIKIALDKYQKENYPELINSLPEHGKKKAISKEEILQTIKAERQTDKNALITLIEKTHASSNSKDHFLLQLKDVDAEPYYRNGRLQGVTFQGKKFRLNRLGFDDSKLHTFDHVKSKEEKELSALKDLRNNNKELRRNIIKLAPKKDTSLLIDEAEKALNELSLIRNSKNSITKEKYEAVDDHSRNFGTEELKSTSEETGQVAEEDIPTFGIFTNLIKPIAHENE